MNLYTKEQTLNIHEQNFAFLEIKETDKVLTITLNRERKRNALHPQMMNEIAYALHYAHFASSVWTIILKAKGKVFCAGADLKAFAGIIEENDSTIPEPNGDVLMAEMFNQVHKPVIAKVTGDVYAGGFFFLAGSTYVVALDSVKFGLPEVKRGLYPMQVMAALLKVMPARKVIDWCIRGYNLPVQKAYEYGLATHVATEENIDEIIQGIINDLKENSPTAIRLGLAAYDKITQQNSEHEYLLGMLRQAIASKDGQEGLTAFREKRTPNWTGE